MTAVSFQHFDSEFDELVDLEHCDDVIHLEKLNVVITPVLFTPQTYEDS